MRERISTALELAGFAGLSYAGWLVAEPLGIALGSVFAVLVGFVAGRET